MPWFLERAPGTSAKPRQGAQAKEPGSQPHAAPVPVGIEGGLHDFVGEGPVAGESLFQEAGHEAGRSHDRAEFAKCR